MRNSFCFIFIIFSFVLTQCDNLSEVNCVDNENCDWISDVVNMNCSSLSNQTSCENYSNYGCDWTWSWGGWMNSGSSCTGGTFQIDYGYCEDSLYQLGDINQDYIVNIQDLIQIINLILVEQYNDLADMNFDGIINVIDALQIVNIILEG